MKNDKEIEDMLRELDVQKVWDDYVTLAEKMNESADSKTTCFLLQVFTARMIFDLAPNVEEAKIVIEKSVEAAMAWKKKDPI